MSNPKVSIIIPVYNGSNYLRKAIDSALSQTYKNIEILIINDGSNDSGKTEKIALSYGEKIRYLHKENGGVATALNLGIKKMTGEYFSWLSHDDLYYSNKIEENLKELEKFENIEKIILFNDYEQVDENEKILSYKKAPKESDIFLSYITNKYIFFGGSLLIPKKAFDEVGKFKDLRTTQDYDMWLRMLKAGYKFINQSKFLNKCRIHGEQDSINKKGLMLKEQKIVQKYIFQIFCLNELKEKSGYKYNKYLLYIYIKLILYKNNVLGYSTIFCQKIGIYNLIAPMYRKLFIK